MKTAAIFVSFVVACGSADAPDHSEPNTTSDSESDSGSANGGEKTDDSTGSTTDEAATCELHPIAPTQRVTFHVTNASANTRWLATRGNHCSTLDIERAGTRVPQEPGYQMLCEGPNPGMQRVNRFYKLEPGESIEVEWMASELELCTRPYDCAAHGWPGLGVQDEWISAVRPAKSGTLTATFPFEATLPPDCSVSPDPTVKEAMCPTQGGWGPGTVSPSATAPLCTASKSASIAFTLPASGDLTVEVAVP